MEKNSAKNKGFTILELIVAIFVMTTGIIGAYIAVQAPLHYTGFYNTQLTAYYLAQEGVEIVRNIRDTNWVAGGDWNTGLDICNSASGFYCEADYNDSALTQRSIALQPSNLNISSNLYSYAAGGVSTAFGRKIEIIPGTDANGKDILKTRVVVSWGANQVQVSENLYSWYK